MTAAAREALPAQEAPARDKGARGATRSGTVLRHAPVGLHGGAPLTFLEGAGAPSLAEVFALAAPDMIEAEARLAELVASEVDVVAAIGDYLRGAGGKRLRPLLTALGARAAGFEGPLDGLMCAGELIHLGSLLHDDVVDEADTRRGRPAAHRVYSNPAVILSGDFCLARAVLLAAEEGGHAAVTSLADAVTRMAEGEVLQLQRAGNLSTTLPEYLEMVDKKSAALIAWCASAGALARGAAQAAEALAAFGRGVGVAFQVTDDVLDYAEGTGKDPGQDLREKKLTLPLLLAMADDASLRADVEADDGADVAALMDRVRRTGALERALSDARSRVETAIAALHVLPPSRYRDGLVVLGRHLAERAT